MKKRRRKKIAPKMKDLRIPRDLMRVPRMRSDLEMNNLGSDLPLVHALDRVTIIGVIVIHLDRTMDIRQIVSIMIDLFIHMTNRDTILGILISLVTDIQIGTTAIQMTGNQLTVRTIDHELIHALIPV